MKRPALAADIEAVLKQRCGITEHGLIALAKWLEQNGVTDDDELRDLLENSCDNPNVEPLGREAKR